MAKNDYFPLARKIVLHLVAWGTVNAYTTQRQPSSLLTICVWLHHIYKELVGAIKCQKYTIDVFCFSSVIIRNWLRFIDRWRWSRTYNVSINQLAGTRFFYRVLNLANRKKLKTACNKLSSFKTNVHVVRHSHMGLIFKFWPTLCLMPVWISSRQGICGKPISNIFKKFLQLNIRCIPFFSGDENLPISLLSD